MRFSLVRSELFRRAGTYTIANVVNSSIPFLLLPVLTRYLTPSQYGLVSMFTVLTAVVVAVVGLGTHGAVTREFYHRDRDDFAAFVGTTICILMASALVLLAIVLLFSEQLAAATGIPSSWLWIAVPMGAGQVLSSIGLSIWQVRGMPAVYGSVQIGMSLINALLSLALIVVAGMGWEGRVIGQAVAPLIVGVLAIAMLTKGGWIRLRYCSDDARQALRYGVPLVFHALGSTAVVMADKTIVANLVSLSETGLYVVAGQLAMIITFLADSFNRAYAPWLFQELKIGDTAVRRKIVLGTYGYFLVVLLLAGFLALLAPPFIGTIVGPEFRGATEYIFLLALASAFGGMYYMVTLYIQFSGRTERLAAVTLTVGALNVMMCYWLVREQGGIGAAFATMGSQLLMFLATWAMAAKVVDMNWLLRPQTLATEHGVDRRP